MSETDDTAERQPIARLPRPTATSPTTIAVVGDPHVSTRREGGQRLPEHSEEHFRRAIADINRRDVDGTVSVGDLSANGGPWDFEAIDSLLSDLQSPFVSVPGNHDVPATSSADHEVLPQEEFEERYAGGSVPLVRQFGDVDIVGLDSMRLQRALDSEATEEQIEWLDERLVGLDDPVVMLHHPLPGMTDWLSRYEDRVEELTIPRLWENPDPLLDVLENRDVPLVLSGHKHMPGIARTRGVWEAMAPSTCTFPQGYLLLEITRSGTDVSFVPVADHEGLEEAFLRRHTAFTKTRMYASAAAILLSSPPIDARNGDTK
ncbi:metallophosphoesterase family protein [Natribaculum luteum]|uniref:Metallophosphoesterase family protein n=1 Tax=Natribaculum luteum TaxID=1586232 RepID=A0ABD5P0G6_9EURY|nr:metallophosphoesterase [Natribaculum luteum]